MYARMQAWPSMHACMPVHLCTHACMLVGVWASVCMYVCRYVGAKWAPHGCRAATATTPKNDASLWPCLGRAWAAKKAAVGSGTVPLSTTPTPSCPRLGMYAQLCCPCPPLAAIGTATIPNMVKIYFIFKNPDIHEVGFFENKVNNLYHVSAATDTLHPPRMPPPPPPVHDACIALPPL